MKRPVSALLLMILVVVVLLSGNFSEAGWPRRATSCPSGACQSRAATVTYQAPVYAAPQAVQATPQSQPAGDSYGFAAWLNATRAAHGRHPVAIDAVMMQAAIVNNSYQRSRGLGHWWMGPARRQDAGWGQAASVWPMWLASPAHAAALLDPTITVIGIAFDGSFWTFSAR